jgi:hypothetical protein
MLTGVAQGKARRHAGTAARLPRVLRAAARSARPWISDGRRGAGSEHIIECCYAGGGPYCRRADGDDKLIERYSLDGTHLHPAYLPLLAAALATARRMRMAMAAGFGSA